MDRRRALFTLAGLATATAGAVLLPATAEARSPGRYSLAIERAGGGQFPAYWHQGSLFVAGAVGHRYNIRVYNHASVRIEAVVSVDGRDVLTGENASYKRHRGYVIDPYSSVLIDGFRQSMSSVASFRFTPQSNAYSSRMGTPQNVGVIGAAIFQEKPRPKPRHRAVRPPRPSPPPRPYYEDEPYAPYGGGPDYGGAAPYDEAAPSSPAPRKNGGKGKRGGSAESAPSADRDHAYGGDDGYGGGYGGYYTPPPSYPPERLGTEYGESQYSAVEEVPFKRKRKSRPDALLTAYYDSIEGLRARGVPVDPPVVYPPYPEPEPEPWPDRRFAPPPPRY